MDPSGSERGQECIIFTLKTYQATFIRDIFYATVGVGSVTGTERDRMGRTDKRMYRREG